MRLYCHCYYIVAIRLVRVLLPGCRHMYKTGTHIYSHGENELISTNSYSIFKYTNIVSHFRWQTHRQNTRNAYLHVQRMCYIPNSHICIKYPPGTYSKCPIIHVRSTSRLVHHGQVCRMLSLHNRDAHFPYVNLNVTNIRQSYGICIYMSNCTAIDYSCQNTKTTKTLREIDVDLWWHLSLQFFANRQGYIQTWSTNSAATFSPIFRLTPTSNIPSSDIYQIIRL
jgi:hypothetical protein